GAGRDRKDEPDRDAVRQPAPARARRRCRRQRGGHDTRLHRGRTLCERERRAGRLFEIRKGSDLAWRLMPDVVLPVLAEAEALAWVLGRMPPGYRAIVADNGSTDGSARIASALGATVVREPRRGFGAACFAGLCVAKDAVVCFMDCDGSLDPAELPLVAD